MKIRTQFVISTVLFGFLLLVSGALVIFVDQRVQTTSRQRVFARQIETGAYELGYFANDYLLYRDSRQASQWESRYAAFVLDVSNMRVDTPEQQVLVDRIKTNQTRLKSVFTDIQASLVSMPPTQDGVPEPAFLQTSWSRMEVQNQGLIFDASRLAQLLREQEDQLRQVTSGLNFVLIGLFGALLLANFGLIFRRTLDSIAVLLVGVRVIGAGHLDHVVGEGQNDEIGELSRAFNRMTANLRATTASKAELEREMGERQRAEEHVSHLNQDLQRQSADLEAANQYLEESLAQAQAGRVELEATNRELEAFVYSVAHDLRAPLAQMNELSRALLEDYQAQLPADSQPLLQIIHDHAAATNVLAEDLLTLSRVTQVAPAKQTVHMTELVRHVLTDLAEPEGRRVEIHVADLPTAQADPVLVKQVWVNLIGNALKFTRGCEVARIEISWQREKEATVYSVKDNGAGFNMAQVDRLFRAFHRLHHADDFEGNGLGLAIVQRIVERHGGYAWAEGAVGQGATFYFTLDRAALGAAPRPATDATQATSPESDPTRKDASVIRVLVVDDHQLFRQGLRVLLMKAKDIQIVGEARDGQTALELGQSLQPDVILMDIEMPGLDGIEATQALKGMRNPARILMLTMKTGESDVRKAAQSGAEGYVVKNSSRDELIAAIRSVHQGIPVVSPGVAPFFSHTDAGG
ncbi:MAG: response regulator [Chloroflexi bacterium]|nr:response regulator [Chloroflexota bacterium]